MTASDVRSEISRLVGLLLELDAAVSVNGAVLKRAGADTMVTWSSTEPAALSDHVYASLQEYRHLVRSREYTALLFDGALLQLSYTFTRDEIVSQRFCYYPCPLVLDLDDANSDLVEIIDMRLEEEFDAQKRVLTTSDDSIAGFRLRLRGPLRFEYDAPNARPGHSASHLHILNEDARWPIFGPLSIGHFVRFVFTHFYASSKLQPLREWPIVHRVRTVSEQDEVSLFIDCQQRL